MTDCPNCTQWPDSFCEECENGDRDNQAVLDERLVDTARTAGRRLAVLLAVGFAAASLVLAARVLGW